jgi:serine/threonine protein kinase
MHNLNDGNSGQGIAHRDLKPENMLLSDKNAELPQIKLLDFGTARAFHIGESELTDVAGSVLYLAPEIALKGMNKPQSEEKYPE